MLGIFDNRSSEMRSNSQQLASADSGSTTSNSTREVDQTNEDDGPEFSGPSEQAETDRLATEMKTAIHVSHRNPARGTRSHAAEIDTTSSAGSGVAPDYTGHVLSHLALPAPMESTLIPRA